MKIYIAHTTAFDYQNDLYYPIKESYLWNAHDIILPHQHSKDVIFNSLPVIATCDFLIAEISYPSTGMGIEIGWAVAHNIPVLAIYKQDTKPSSSIKMITNDLYEYDSSSDLIQKITTYILEKNK